LDRGSFLSRYRKGTAPPSSGALDREPIALILRRLYCERVCGILQVKWHGKFKAIEFGEGYPIAVWSNLESERLDARLVATGKLQPTDLDEAHRKLHEGGPLLGEILVALGRLGEEELAAALQEQADEKMLELFSWEGGQYRFRPGETLRRSTRIAVVSSPAALVLRGVTERMPLKLIDDYWDQHGGAELVRSRDPYDRFHDLQLGPGEAAILDAATSGLLVADVRARTEDERRIAYALVQSGLLALHDPDAPGQVAAAARPKAPPRPRSKAPDRPRPTRPPQPAAAAVQADPRARLTKLLKRLEGDNPFERLGLGPDATREAIDKARAQLAYETHPDRFTGAPAAVQRLAQQAFQQIQATYEALSDTERLVEYRKDPLLERHQSEALEDARMALEGERHFQQGIRALKQHRWKPAFEGFRKAVDAYPDEGEYHCYYGWTYYLVHGRREDSLKAAFEHVKHGAKLAPKSAAGWLFLGRLYQMVDRFERAEQMLLRSLQCDPRNVEAMRELRILETRRPKGKVRGLLKRVRGLASAK